MINGRKLDAKLLKKARPDLNGNLLKPLREIIIEKLSCLEYVGVFPNFLDPLKGNNYQERKPGLARIVKNFVNEKEINTKHFEDAGSCTKPLTHKAAHKIYRAIHKEIGVPYKNMLLGADVGIGDVEFKYLRPDLEGKDFRGIKEFIKDGTNSLYHMGNFVFLLDIPHLNAKECRKNYPKLAKIIDEVVKEEKVDLAKYEVEKNLSNPWVNEEIYNKVYLKAHEKGVSFNDLIFLPN